MKIKFIKEYRAIGDFGMPGKAIIARSTIGDTADNLDDEDAQWLIDNGFAEEVKESGWWKPKFGEEYFFLSNTGEVKLYSWENDEIDEYRYSAGNCFNTKDAAERYRDYLKAIATVRQDEGVMTPEEVINAARAGVIVSRLIVNDRTGNLTVSMCNLYSAYPSVGTICFDTYEHAKASLYKHLDEWKIISNYDWSRE